MPVVLSLRTKEAPDFLWFLVQHSSVQCIVQCIVVQCRPLHHSAVQYHVTRSVHAPDMTIEVSALCRLLPSTLHCTAVYWSFIFTLLLPTALSCTVYSTVLCCDAHDCIALYWQTFYMSRNLHKRVFRLKIVPPNICSKIFLNKSFLCIFSKCPALPLPPF